MTYFKPTRLESLRSILASVELQTKSLRKRECTQGTLNAESTEKFSDLLSMQEALSLARILQNKSILTLILNSNTNTLILGNNKEELTKSFALCYRLQ